MAPPRPPDLESGPQSAPFTIRAKAKSRTPKTGVFRAINRQVPLFADDGTDI
jgi:hypothetical protein